jgi:glyoxylase-like metal-dependent hydrolase (beta-lactamase superfamily II)/rhodanese-related sulfurtransferase
MTGIQVIRTPSLGDNSYLVVSGDEAAVIDPQRDSWPLVRRCAGSGVAVRYVLETHVHNDYVSGAREWQAATGAAIVGPARAAYSFPYTAMEDGDEIALGEVTLRALATPGHTPEHTAYLLFDVAAPDPTVVFTGGSLMVGGAGRTDLLGADRADELTRKQCASLRRLLTLGEETRVLPTHGAGSFCAAPTAGATTSTIGTERLTNPALRLLADEGEFVRARLEGLPRYPAYYRFMAPINRSGPRVLAGPPPLQSLATDEVARHLEAGAWMVDARDRWAFARAHLPGSINVELDDSFATSVGSVVPFGVTLVLLLPEPEAAAGTEAVLQLLRIGYDTVAGCLTGGVAAWEAAGRAVTGYPARGIDELDLADPGVLILDVRQPAERADGAIPGSRHIVLGDLPQRMSELPRDRTVWTVCRSGHRAAIAASLLDRAGIAVTAVARGGVPSSGRARGLRQYSDTGRK